MAVHLSSRLSPLSPSVQPLSPRLSPSQRSHSPRHFPSQQLHSPLSPSQQPVAAPLALRDDCYSSNEYVEYVGRRSNDRLGESYLVLETREEKVEGWSGLVVLESKSVSVHELFIFQPQRGEEENKWGGGESRERLSS